MKISIVKLLSLTFVSGALCFFGMMTFSTPTQASRAKLQQPDFPLGLTFDPTNLDAYTQQLYQTMQNIINSYAISPNDRIIYYSAVDNVNGYMVNGWQGIITNVQQNANGYLASIDVLPDLSSDSAASAIIVDSDYSEQFQVFPDGSFQYTRSFDPLGQAGQMPTIIGL